jgi:Protein of unknown function (DUF3108)
MQMKKQIIFILLTLSTSLFSQTNCSITNHSFKSGEEFTYKVVYKWGFIWVEAGVANFSAQLSTLSNKPVYHFVGLGCTVPKYDWIFKVRDKYESYADTVTLKPIRFAREVKEGNTITNDDYVFFQRKNKVYTSSRKYGERAKLDSLTITSCTNDVLTAIFYARCLDFSKYKPNDTIPITFVLDGVVYPSYIRYMGKEVIENDTLGRVRCIKFRPNLIAGSIFTGGEGMTVWVTDDDDKMPVYVETPILVGTVKVFLTKYKGLRNKMNCIENRK